MQISVVVFLHLQARHLAIPQTKLAEFCVDIEDGGSSHDRLDSVIHSNAPTITGDQQGNVKSRVLRRSLVNRVNRTKNKSSLASRIDEFQQATPASIMALE